MIDNKFGNLPASFHKEGCPIQLAYVLEKEVHDVCHAWRVGDGGVPVSAASDSDPGTSLCWGAQLFHCTVCKLTFPQ